jgi:hypothetical protein
VELLSLPAPARAGLAFSDTGKALATAGPRKVAIWGTLAE